MARESELEAQAPPGPPMTLGNMRELGAKAIAGGASFAEMGPLGNGGEQC